MTGKNRPQRRPRDAASTRAALLRAATEVFADVGYAGARVDEIAHRSRISKRMIYDYFGDKQGLYREVLASRLCVTPFSRDDADPRAALEEVVRWYFGLLAADPAFARLLSAAMLVRSSSRRDAALISSAAPALAVLADFTRRGIATGEFRADVHAEMLRTLIVSVCLGYFLQRDVLDAAPPDHGKPWTDEEFLEQGICRVLFDGIGAARGSP